MKHISEGRGKVELGVAGSNTRTGQLRADEFLPELRGRRAIKTFREMRENDSTVGAAMYATEQTLRDIQYKVSPVDDSEAAQEAAEFVQQCLEDMEHTLDDHISEALSSLSYGFSLFEVVYKRRAGPQYKSPKKKSKYSDNKIGIRKLASRAQWTINQFDIDRKTGEVLGVFQDSGYGKSNYIPANKMIHYRTTTTNNDPSGRSILRNAYVPYTYLKEMQRIEAIAVERELTGVPVIRLPANYLSPDATDSEKALRDDAERIARDLKLNEQGYAIFPSDTYIDNEGNPTDVRLMDLELISSNGTRNIEIDPIVRRYQHDIARSIMAEFLMLGGSNHGSYALSKSKTDLFLRSMESYINTIFDVLNKQLIEPLWEINGFDYRLMPKIIPGDVAPHDLRELGAFLRNLNGADINLSNQLDIVDDLLTQAELPTLDREVYSESLAAEERMAQARADYYDDDNIPGNMGQDPSSTKPQDKENG